MSNIAFGKTATANAYVLPFAPSMAVDGSIAPTSRWVSGIQKDVTPWLMVDLGTPSYINRYVVKSMTCAGWTDPKYNNQTFTVSVSSDNANWTQVDTVSGNLLNIVDRTITAVVCRYVRIAFSVGLTINPKLASVVEFEVYDLPMTNLTSLALSNGTLTPTFDGNNVFNYTATEGYDTSAITVTPTAMNSNVQIAVNDVAVTSGTASQPIALCVGSGNVIKVVLTSSTGRSEYDITVTRASSPYLASIGNSVVPFNKTTYNYSASTSNASVNVTLTSEDTKAIINVTWSTGSKTVISGSRASIPLSAGQNIFTINVVSSVGTDSRTYTFNIQH